MSNHLLLYIQKNKQDAITFKADYLMEAAGEDPYEQSRAIDGIKEMLSCIDNEVLLESYTRRCASICGIKAATLVKIIKTEQEQVKKKAEVQNVAEGDKALPAWVNKDRIQEIGFDFRVDPANPKNTGTYFHVGRGWVEQLTNFIMTPIVQILADKESERRRITEVFNGTNNHVFELPSLAFTSTAKLETTLLDHGHYYLKDGFTQSHLNKLKAHYLEQYPTGYEITNLGWQEEGFFAFSNVVYHNGIKKFDKYGLVDIDNQKFLSMGASNILLNLRKGTDSYKNDKHLFYKESPITFKQWTKLMTEVYGDKAMMGIAWCLQAVNRDTVADLTDYCPLPYCYGAAGSGKSQFAASLTALFTMGLRFLNLNQVTVFGFWEYTERFRNILMGYNEFDVQSIPEAITKAFKGMADIEGRVSGSGVKNKTKTQEVNNLPTLIGQYLATMDDNSILSRTMPEKFVEVKDRPDDLIEKFNTLKTYEKLGITSLACDIIEHRGYIRANYKDAVSEVSRRLKEEFRIDGFTPKVRVLQNYTVVLALVKLYADKITFAFSYEDFYAYCKTKIMTLNTLIGESNVVGDFWKKLESFADSGFIEPGWDYKIESHKELKSMIGNKSSKNVVNYDNPTRFLFIRFANCYGPIAKDIKMLTGKPATNESTVKGYLEEQPYYVGAQSGGNFKSKKQGLKKNTSSMVLNYDMLLAAGVNLLEEQEEEELRELSTITGKIQADARLQDNWGKVQVMFSIHNDEGYTDAAGMRIDKTVFTKCLWADKEKVRMLTGDSEVRVIGYLNTKRQDGKEWRTMEVTEVQMIRAVERAGEPETPPAPPEQGNMFDPNHTQQAAF